MGSLLPRDRVMPGEPDTKCAGRELVSRDDAVVDANRETAESDAAPYASSAWAPVEQGMWASHVPSRAYEIACRTPRDSTPLFHRSRPPRMAPE